MLISTYTNFFWTFQVQVNYIYKLTIIYITKCCKKNYNLKKKNSNFKSQCTYTVMLHRRWANWFYFHQELIRADISQCLSVMDHFQISLTLEIEATTLSLISLPANSRDRDFCSLQLTIEMLSSMPFSNQDHVKTFMMRWQENDIVISRKQPFKGF